MGGILFSSVYESIAKRWHIVCPSTLLGPSSLGSDRTNTPWGSIALPPCKGDFLLFPVGGDGFKRKAQGREEGEYEDVVLRRRGGEGGYFDRYVLPI